MLAVHDLLRQDVLGAGPLEPLLRLPGVTDVLVNGPDAVYVDRGEGLELTSIRFADDAAVRRLAQRLAAARSVGGSTTRRRTSTCGCPTAPGSTPCSRRWPGPAPCISLRVPRARVFTLEELRRARARSTPTAPRCSGGSSTRRLAFLVSGGTGSGKTTLLSALLSLVDPRRPAGDRRGRQRAAPRPPARRRARVPARQRRGRRRGRRCGCWSGRRCGCGPTGSSSARSAATRSPTCSPR